MSYYNAMYAPTLKRPEEIEIGDPSVFTEKCKGFDKLVKEMGEEFVQVNPETELKEIVFEEVKGGSDYIRPRDLDWTWLSKDAMYDDANCFIYVHDLHNRIDWSKVSDIDQTEKSIGYYQKHVKKHGAKLIILPV